MHKLFTFDKNGSPYQSILTQFTKAWFFLNNMIFRNNPNRRSSRFIKEGRTKGSSKMI